MSCTLTIVPSMALRQAPSAKRQAPSAKKPYFARVVIRAIIPFAAIFSVGCSGSPAADEIPANEPVATLFTPPSPWIDFGILPRGGSKQQHFWIRNNGASPVEIVDIDSDCHCLTIELPKSIIRPSEKMRARAKVALEPDFQGKLRMQVKGMTKNGDVALGLVVEVEVQD